MEGLRNWINSGDPQQSVNRTCHVPAEDLVDCIKETACFQSGRSLRDCARTDDEAGRVCRKEINEWFLCRRFSVDHSKHFTKDAYK